MDGVSYISPFIITDKIIDLIARISQALGKLDRLQHSPQAIQLRKISQIKTITGTLQIEGSTLLCGESCGGIDHSDRRGGKYSACCQSDE